MMRAAERTSIPSSATLLVAIAVSLCACDRGDAISERRAPKGVEVILSEAQPDQAEHTHVDAGSANIPSGVGVEWDLPVGWRETPSDNPTRIAVFVLDDAPDVEVVVTRFPGDVGGTLANVNRWRAQMGLGPIDDASLAAQVDRLTVPGFNAYLFGATNADRGLVAAGLEEPSRSRTWFVKATSTERSFDRARESVLAFVRSFRVRPESE
jgi:hypothetical protein